MEYVFRRFRKHLILLVLLAFSFSTWVWADKIPPSNPGEDTPREVQEYLDRIYNNWQILEITTTAPNGNLKGKIGKVILYETGGTFSLWVNTTSSTVWQQL